MGTMKFRVSMVFGALLAVGATGCGDSNTEPPGNNPNQVDRTMWHLRCAAAPDVASAPLTHRLCVASRPGKSPFLCGHRLSQDHFPEVKGGMKDVFYARPAMH